MRASWRAGWDEEGLRPTSLDEGIFRPFVAAGLTGAVHMGLTLNGAGCAFAGWVEYL